MGDLDSQRGLLDGNDGPQLSEPRFVKIPHPSPLAPLER